MALKITVDKVKVHKNKTYHLKFLSYETEDGMAGYVVPVSSVENENGD